MRKVAILFMCVFACLMSSCGNNPKPEVHKPTAAFEDFTAYLDTAGYLSDTSRTQKLLADEVKDALVFHSGKSVFFIQAPEHQLILRNKENWGANKQVDYAAFEKALFISVYYYYGKDRKIVVEDGVIEEWQFRTAGEAKKALHEFNKIKDLVYFNTDSFSFQSMNRLYVFHTRAVAFNETLEQFYTTFRKRI